MGILIRPGLLRANGFLYVECFRRSTTPEHLQVVARYHFAVVFPYVRDPAVRVVIVSTSCFFDPLSNRYVALLVGGFCCETVATRLEA